MLVEFLRRLLVFVQCHLLVVAHFAGLGSRGMRKHRLRLSSFFRGLLQTFKECYAVVRIDRTRKDCLAVIDEYEIIFWSNRLSGCNDLV